MSKAYQSCAVCRTRVVVIQLWNVLWVCTHHTFIHLYHWCCDLICREVEIGKVVLLLQFIFLIHVYLNMEIDICINQERNEVRGMEPNELWSNVFSVSIDLLFNVGTTFIKLFIILACMITTCIDIFIEIPVIYVIQFSSYLLQMLVHELQELFMLTKTMLVVIEQTVSNHYCDKRHSSLCQHSHN